MHRDGDKPPAVAFMTGQADVEASDARGGRAPDPRDDGKESPCRQTGQHPDRGGLRQMRRAEPRSGGKGRNPRQIRLQAMRRQAGDAVSKAVIAREGGQSSIPETPAMESKGRGVLDTPHSRGMTADYDPFTNF